MGKRKFHLTALEAAELTDAYRQCPDRQTCTRYQAVRLYGTGYALDAVKEITGCNTTSLMEWCQAYRTGRSDALKDKRRGGNSAKLSTAQRAQLPERLHQYTPHDLFGSEAQTADGRFWTVEDLQGAVERWYGVRYASRSSYYNLFQACGFSYQRTAKVFKSQRPQQIATFEEQVEKN